MNRLVPPGRGRFRGATAIVTGAASGIGRSLTLALAQRGATVYAADRDEVGLADVAVAAAGGDVAAVPLDVTDQHAVDDAVRRAICERGRLDFMFNNAGIVVGGDFADMTDAAWQRIVDINLWGVVYGTQAAYAQMLGQGFGHIVNTSSSAGVLPVPRSTAYAATKHAVVGLSVSLRAEAAARGIRVSVVLPGIVDTNIFDSATNLHAYNYRSAIDHAPMRKVSPDAAADAILRGVVRNDAIIAFPALNRLIIGLYRTMPTVMAPIVTRGGM